MTDQITGDHLRQFIEHLEGLASERATILQEFNDILADAKSAGFDTKIIRKILARRKLAADEAAEQDAIMDLYLAALEGQK